MTVEKLLTCLRGVTPQTEIGFPDECGYVQTITHVVIKDGRVLVGSGYSSEDNFWNPGNGNLDGHTVLLGHDWPK